MILVGPSGDLLPKDSFVSKEFVEMCNLRMAAHSYRQVFSSSPDSLALIRDTLPLHELLPRMTARIEDLTARTS